MPSLFSRKRHESTPALQTAPSPPPKDFSMSPRAPLYSTPSQSQSSPSSTPSSPYSHSLPTARTRRTSTPAYSRSHASSSSSSSSTLDARLRAHRPPSTAYTSLPRRPSPLSGPPLVAPSASTTSLHSQLYSHEQSLSPPARPRSGSSRMASTPRPHSELLFPSSSAHPNERAARPEMKRSISVVGDDWMRAYEAVEYDLDLDFGRLKVNGSAAAEPRSDYSGDSEESDTEGPGETDAMLGTGPAPVDGVRMAPGDRNNSPSTSPSTNTRHARTPSAGWRAWSGDYDQVDVGVDAPVNSPPTEQSRLPAPIETASHTLPPPSVPVVSITPAPAPEHTPSASSDHPPNLNRYPSTPSLQSTPSVSSTSSQKSMGSINPNAPLPPLPSPVKSPLLERARSKSHEPVSAPVAPPTPPKDSAADLQTDIGSDISLHVRAATEGGSSLHPPLFSAPESLAPANVIAASSVPPINEPPKPIPSLSPAESYISHTGAQIPRQDALVSSSGPQEQVPVSLPPVERPAPPFLVLSYKAPPSARSPAAMQSTAAQPLPAPLVPPLTALAPQPAPAAAIVLLPSTSTPKTTIIPPGGAPQRRDPPSSPSNLSPMPAQLSPSPSSFPTTSPSSSPYHPSSSPPTPPLASLPATTPPHPHPHNPRGSMILYHVTLPSTSGTRPGLPHGHTYQSFGTLGAHTNRHSAGPINAGEDGMLLPPVPSSGSGSASSSALNLFSNMNTGDAASPPPANRYSSHSYSRSSTYSASAHSVAAPSYTSVPPLEDRDGKYAVGLMIGTVKSAQFQTLPRIGTPLSASFALRDASPNAGADAHLDIDLKQSIRGSVLGGGGVLGPIVAYPYDPDEDDSDDDADGDGAGGGREDWLHDPDVWPYADGDEDFHARRGDWKVPARRWWGGAKDRPTGGALRKEAGGERNDEMVQLEMLGSTSTASRTSMYKAPLQPPLSPNLSSRPRSYRHPYLPPYNPPTTLDTLLGRGAASAFTLVVLIVGLLALFIVYPITQVFGPEARVAEQILGNTAINSTGQAGV